MTSSPTHGSERGSGSADPHLLADSLAALTGEPVEMRSTHMSWIVLTAEHAYKLKRPVLLDFADMRDPQIRAASCRRELALNDVLAPGLGIAVRAIVPGPDGYVLADDDDPRAIDHVIEMHRYDEGRTMRSLLERGRLTPAQARATGRCLGAFHRASAPLRVPIDEQARFAANAQGLRALLVDPALVRQVDGLERFARAFATAWGDVLAARRSKGCIVDGHGDVRAEHVLLDEDGSVRIVDRLDIDDLRRVDMADDLAFLVMDLESHDGEGFVGDVLEGYAEGGGAVPPTALLAYFAAYRALVRAKVSLLPEAAGGDRSGPLVALARASAWRARGPVLLLVTGPPASGKSTLAEALGHAGAIPVLSSDAVRAEHPSLGYGDAARASIYRELARRAGSEGSFVVDATFGEPGLQDAFFRAIAAHPQRVTLTIECEAPAELRLARAEARHGGEDDHLSDAGADVARELGERFVSVPGSRTDGRLVVDATTPVEDQLDAIEAWLDQRLSAGALS